MRICLFGGMANDLYLIAKSFAGAGADVIFIRDRGHRLPFGQPVWQDYPVVLEGDEVQSSYSWSMDQWNALEKKLGWKAPSWLVDPNHTLEASPRLALNPLDSMALKAMMRRRDYLAPTLEFMRESDLIITNGYEGSSLALASGKPFVLWPYGDDIRFAAGKIKPAGLSLAGRVERAIWKRLLSKAYAKTKWVGSHDPYAAGGDYGDMLECMAPGKHGLFALPVPVGDVTHDKASRRARLDAALTAHGIGPAQEEFTMLIPSRIDFFWKGSDRLFAALENAGAAGRMRVYVTGWGKDRERALEQLADSPMRDYVTFLPFILSKPLLYEIMSGVDVVADQFSLGGYGLAALESLACGAPMLTYVDVGRYRQKNFPIPPVINGKSEEAITLALQSLLGGRLDLEALSRDSVAWIKKHHGMDAVANAVLPKLEKIVRSGA